MLFQAGNASLYLSSGKISPLAQAMKRALICMALLQAPHAFAANSPSLQASAISLDEGLNQFARETGISLVMNAEITAGKTVSAVPKKVPAQQGLNALLQGSGLVAHALGNNSFAIEPSPQRAVKKH